MAGTGQMCIVREISMSSDASEKPATESKPAPESPKAATPPSSRRAWVRPVIVTVAVLIVLAAAVPLVRHALDTVSTDDAYVNSYVTFVAARVPGQVTHVLVDNNNRVKKGDILVQLDPEPYQVQVAIKEAAVDTALANLMAADADVHGMVAQLRGERFALTTAMEDVDNQVAVIRARVAQWEQSKATLVLAQQEFDRASRLVSSNAVSIEDVEVKKASLDEAKAQVNHSLQDVYEARASLGLPASVPDGQNLTDVPPDIDQSFSTVRTALATLLKSAAQLGVVPSSYKLTPKEAVDEFYRRDPAGNVDQIFDQLIKNAPALKQAQAAVAQAQRDLAQANLNLRYCTVVSEIDGVVTRRNVNPGNNVQAGQSLMAVRSLKDIWIDANFKETQLRDLRIGQRVELRTDMYGSRHTFEGRITGFTMGTGSTLALLPPENATGNFVKVVQRLPVRIDVMNYDSDKIPLFVGISVTPVVDLLSPPTGPNAGRFLQAPIPMDEEAYKPLPK